MTTLRFSTGPLTEACACGATFPARLAVLFAEPHAAVLLTCRGCARTFGANVHEEGESVSVALAGEDAKAVRERGISAIDLVVHDWRNMPEHERQQALEDVRALAESEGSRGPSEGARRRARALNIMATFFHFLTEANP